MTPHIHVFKSAGKGPWQAVFAVRLESCHAERLDPQQKEAAVLRWLARQMDFINALYAPDGLRTFAVRFITRPRAEMFSAGRVEIALLGKTNAPTKTAAAEAAIVLCRDIAALLSGAMPDYQWTVVGGRADFQAVWTPFALDAAHICELRRREDLVSLESFRSRPSLGRGRTDTALSPAELKTAAYFVHQFLPRPTTLARFLRTVLLHSEPVMFQVALRPVRLEPPEKAALHELISRCEQWQRSDGRRDPFGTTSHQARAGALCQGLLELSLRLEDAPYLLHVALASPAPLPATLVEGAGIEITHPVSNRLSGEAGGLATLQVGGYDTVFPRLETEHAIARQNTAQLEFTTWGESLAPAPLSRLRQLVDAGEAAGAFRFPLATLDGLAGIEVRAARFRPLPRDLADLAAGPESERLRLGENLALGHRQPVFLSDRDRRQHTYVVGQTGTGKTTLLRTMILNDMACGRGLAVLDPHGDLFRDLLLHIPPHREKDVIVFDPTDTDHPVGLNLLECSEDEERYFAVREMRAIVERLVLDQYGQISADWMGPAFFQHMQMNMLLAMSNPDDPGTLLEFYQIFQSKTFWKRWLPLRWQDSRLRSWVENNLPSIDYLRRGGDNQLTWGEYLSSKFDDFIFDPKLRLIFGQKRSTIRLREIMDEGKILLVNLAKGELAEANSRFLGMVLMAKIQAAAMSRSDVPIEQRRLFYLYVDEFQSIATANFISMLSEARKFGLALVLANQFLSQVRDKRIMAGIFGNVGTHLCFRVGREDAEMLEPQFAPYFDRFDLGNLPNWTACVRTAVRGQVTAPFTLRTARDECAPDARRAARVVESSRARYARPRAAVEEAIAESLAQNGKQVTSEAAFENSKHLVELRAATAAALRRPAPVAAASSKLDGGADAQ